MSLFVRPVFSRPDFGFAPNEPDYRYRWTLLANNLAISGAFLPLLKWDTATSRRSRLFTIFRNNGNK